MTAHLAHLSHPKYRADIDGLRAVAVLAVIAYHAFPQVIRGGIIGVDIFFVISGYLISTIIFENLDNGTFSLTEFYARRIKRIFPALILVLVSCFIFGWFALLVDEFKQLGKHIAGGAAFISNLVLWNESGYFDNDADTKPLLHLWSLGVEEQFYIVWPWMLWMAHKKRFNLLGIGVLAALVSFYLNIHQVKADLVAAFYSPQTRFWELMFGSILAWITLYKPTTTTTKARLSAEHEDIGKPFASALSVAALLMLFYGLLRIDRDVAFPGTWALIPALSAVSLIHAGPKAWVNRTILSNKIAVWCGLISFPLYLWHWPLLSFARILESESPSTTIRIAAIALSVVLAWLTYILVERPIRWGNHGKNKTAALIVLMATIGCVGYYTYHRDGLPSRKSLSAISPQIVRLGEDDPDSHKACLDYYKLSGPIRYCRLSTYENNRPRIALIGDSHAAALFSGLSVELLRKKEGLLLLAGRLFTNVAYYPEGNQFEVDVYKGGILATTSVANNKDIDTVIMVSRGPVYIDSDAHFFLLDDPNITDKRKVFEIGMRKTLDLLVANKKRIIFALDNPDEIGFDPEKCQGKRPLSPRRNFDCSTPRASFDARQKEYREIVFSVLRDYPSVILFDQAAYFCNQTSCSFKEGASVLYGDSHHLSQCGSEFIASKLMSVLSGAPSKILE
jgi:peptidoglycan/LPS O-acetylase OafA/YrhL